ncbi:MAG: hypothetical protein ACFFC5_07570 [Promethearchaeota archaeon]
MSVGEISEKDLLIIIGALREVEQIIRRPRCQTEHRIKILRGECKHSEGFKSYPLTPGELPERLDELYQILLRVYGDVRHTGEGQINIKE